MKTSSDIKSGLDHIRRRGVICRTRQVEDDVKKDIEEKYGKITIPERELRKILRREKIHAQKKERARKTLMKAFQQREMALMIQKLRTETDMGGAGTAKKSGAESSRVPVERQEMPFNEIEFEY